MVKRVVNAKFLDLEMALKHNGARLFPGAELKQEALR